MCDWLYPLMASDSPVLLCNNGVFMFPDVMAPTPGYYVGVVLSSELPAADRKLFQDLLAQSTDLRVQVWANRAVTTQDNILWKTYRGILYYSRQRRSRDNLHSPQIITNKFCNASKHCRCWLYSSQGKLVVSANATREAADKQDLTFSLFWPFHKTLASSFLWAGTLLPVGPASALRGFETGRWQELIRHNALICSHFNHLRDSAERLSVQPRGRGLWLMPNKVIFDA